VRAGRVRSEGPPGKQSEVAKTNGQASQPAGEPSQAVISHATLHARDQTKLSVPAILLGKARRIVNVALVPELMAGFVAAVKPSRCTFDATQSLANRKH
jgi:hypothetical protein